MQMQTLHSRVLGEGDPLLILHGFLGMSDNWKTQGGKFVERGWQVHLIDQRNHGRSFWSDAFNYSLMAEDLNRYMDEQGLTAATIMGHSMGGKTAMTFACAYPHRVRRLLVADISPREYPPHHGAILGALDSLDLETISSRKEADLALSQSISDWGIRQFLLKNLYWAAQGTLGFRFNLPILKNSMEAIGAELPLGARYEGPSCFIRGERSDYVLDADIERIQHHFPLATLQTIEGAGHWLHAEKPDVYFEICRDFMES